MLSVSLVVGFPDSLVAPDPSTQIGLVPVGTAVSLRYVHASVSNAMGSRLYQVACATPDVVPDTLRWAVSDSAVASIDGGAGHAVLRARAPGTFSVLTTSVASGVVPSALWIAGIVACPSGRVLKQVRVTAP